MKNFFRRFFPLRRFAPSVCFWVFKFICLYAYCYYGRIPRRSGQRSQKILDAARLVCFVTQGAGACIAASKEPGSQPDSRPDLSFQPHIRTVPQSITVLRDSPNLLPVASTEGVPLYTVYMRL
jgi:hypothetical protein